MIVLTVLALVLYRRFKKYDLRCKMYDGKAKCTLKFAANKNSADIFLNLSA